MSIISKFCLTLFEILNEFYIAAGTGIFGAIVLLKHGFKTSQFLRNLTVAAISCGGLMYVFHCSYNLRPSKRKVVFITGCDSGLGFSLVHHVSQLGYTVFGGFLSLDSEGARHIALLDNNKVKCVQLDVTNRQSIGAAVDALEEFLEAHPKYELYALVNNCAVMVFGEFEWQTEKLIQQQCNVNLIGPLILTKQLCPLLRKSKGRIINISSHCALSCLPGLAVYGATKAALSAFTDGLRVEMAKYHVKVVNFIPGSFTMQSNIMGHHQQNVEEMRRDFTPEQVSFYGDYFERYHKFLANLKSQKSPKKMENDDLYSKFEDALMCEQPSSLYKTEPNRYMFYHFFFKFAPTFIRDHFVLLFMQMPNFKPDIADLEDSDSDQ